MWEVIRSALSRIIVGIWNRTHAKLGNSAERRIALLVAITVIFFAYAILAQSLSQSAVSLVQTAAFVFIPALISIVSSFLQTFIAKYISPAKMASVADFFAQSKAKTSLYPVWVLLVYAIFSFYGLLPFDDTFVGQGSSLLRGTFIVLALICLLPLMDYMLIRLRLHYGLYGTNPYEAAELIEFMRSSHRPTDGPMSGLPEWKEDMAGDSVEVGFTQPARRA